MKVEFVSWQIAGVNWKTPGATVLPQMSAHAVHVKPEIKSEAPAIQPVVIQPVNPEMPKKVCYSQTLFSPSHHNIFALIDVHFTNAKAENVN